MRAIEVIKDNKGHVHPILVPMALFFPYALVAYIAVRRWGAGVISSTELQVLAIAVATLPIWASVLCGAVAVLLKREGELLFIDYAVEAFRLIVGAVLVLGMLWAVTICIVSIF